MKIGMIVTDYREDYRRYDEPEPNFHTAISALLQGFATLPESEVHVISCTQKPLLSPERIADNIHYHSVRVGKWGWLRGAYVGCTLATRWKLRQIRPDIVHGQGTERNCAIGAIASGFPNVLTVHGNMRQVARVNHARPFDFFWLTAGLERLTLPRTQGVICISSYTRNEVKGLARRMWQMPNAVDESFFGIEKTVSKRRLILCAGTIDQRKNQNWLIHALAPIAEGFGLEMLFLGDIPPISAHSGYGQEFKENVARHKWCRFEGFAGRSKLKDILKDTFLLIVPSLEDNCPMIVLEAMAAGVPVAAARIGGIPDLVVPGRTGWLFGLDNMVEIRQAVTEAMQHPESTSEMGFAGKSKAHQEFRGCVIASKHMVVYHEILGNSYNVVAN